MTPEAYNAEILRELKQIRSDVAEIKARVLSGGGSSAGGSFGNDEGEVASDRELDSQYGNNPIKKDPSGKYWSGESYVSCRFSEVPPEYLDAFAKWKDASAYMKNKDANDLGKSADDREKAKKYAGYDKKDARLARGWAKRLREGWNGASASAPRAGGGNGGAMPDDQFANDDDIPFIGEASQWWKP